MVKLQCALALLGLNIPIGSDISLNILYSLFYNKELTPLFVLVVTKKYRLKGRVPKLKSAKVLSFYSEF